MPWRDEDSRALLLELWMTGIARRRSKQRRALGHLEQAGWTTASSRASEVALVERHRADLACLLDGCWDEWRSVAQALSLADLQPTAAGLRELRRVQRELPHLPRRLSQRTAAALVADHSKAALGPEHLDMLGSTRIVRDGAALIRPSAGLELIKGGRHFDASELTEVQGVLAITQRALQDGTGFEGNVPRVVMTVENLGAFADLPKPPWLLLVHVPGWNVPLAVDVILALGVARVVHFGDLDPNGIRIFELLRARLGQVELWVPDIWREVVASGPVLSCEWPEGLIAERHPALVHELAAEDRWAEQERVVVAEGVGEALSALW